MVVSVQFYADYPLATPRHQFQRDAAGAREQVQCFAAVEVNILSQYVEDVFLGKVCRGPCLERTRYIEMPPLVFPGDDTHNFSISHGEATL